jgi:hypothetical protein
MVVGLKAVVINVFDPAGYVPNYISSGDSLLGYHTYELGATDVSPDPRIGGYKYTGAPNSLVVYADSGWAFQTDETNVLIYFSIADSFMTHGLPYDGYLFRSDNNTAMSSVNGDWLPMGIMEIELTDYSLQALSSDSLPCVPPDLVDWPTPRRLLIAGDDFAWEITAEIVSFTLVSPSGVNSRPRLHAWLGNAFPNPFNPSAVFPFRLGSSGQVAITIHDIRGSRVRQLVDEWREAGTYEVRWDGIDQAGNRVASGIYFCRLTFRGGTSVRKVTLLK